LCQGRREFESFFRSTKGSPQQRPATSRRPTNQEQGTEILDIPPHISTTLAVVVPGLPRYPVPRPLFIQQIQRFFSYLLGIWPPYPMPCGADSRLRRALPTSTPSLNRPMLTNTIRSCQLPAALQAGRRISLHIAEASIVRALAMPVTGTELLFGTMSCPLRLRTTPLTRTEHSTCIMPRRLLSASRLKVGVGQPGLSRVVLEGRLAESKN
jgi:hypothetical protein